MAEAAEKKAEETSSETTREPKLSIEELLANARPLTGYNRHILAGALHGETGNFTATQAKRKAQAFAERKVEV